VFLLEINVTSEEVIKEEIQKIQQSISGKINSTQIPTQHPFQLETRLVTNFHAANKDKFRVFRDLWLSGAYITTGDSFGCDFLTYPGDPMLYHASQMIHVIKSDEEFDQTYFTSCGRLSVSVRKKCVFAYVNEDNDEITYQTLEWDNPKLRELYLIDAESSKHEEEDEMDDLV
jgi:tRNA-splicing endonuclease subunit Sen34